ncbi:MAG TPA: GspE/PulE family protein [Verrucomicrobiales bacterium]|jgi:type IV pilus assembly protein PilB|nr:GspE/PulE family protein [Verrucomicrobiales bacterium]
MTARYVLDLFQSRGLLDDHQIQEILDEVSTTGKEVKTLLTDYGFVKSPDEVYEIIAEELGAEYADLRRYEPPRAVLDLMPGSLAKMHGALPVSFDESGLHVALMEPLNPQTVEDLRFAIGKPIVVVVGDEDRIEELIGTSYASENEGVEDILASIKGTDIGKGGGVEAEVNAAPIVRYVDLVLFQAVKQRASDIHFEPFEGEFKIRYRVDGALVEMAPPPPHLGPIITSRLKVMANLNIAERRIPQDGRIMKVVGGKPIDMRVSTLPTIHGESVVLRVLDRSSVNLDLETLKLPEAIYDYIIDTIAKPNGIFIVTGPTGAGKTTTLYAALRKVNTVDSKLLTVEDPVEYDIEGILQVPTNDAIGVNFAKVLRAFLRQDPDRIMVGEMRDKETATIAIQASLTGHLVLSTLHTNDAAGAVTRLIDMGCEPFLVAATLEAVLAQRLLRTICKSCVVPYEPTESILTQLGLSVHEIGDKHFYTGRGCDDCGHSGYRGRRGLYELLDVSDPIRDLITEKAPTVVIKQKAVELGMVTLREDGLRNIYNGATTIEEVLKYT